MEKEKNAAQFLKQKGVWILRCCALAMVVLFFLPACLVSCQGFGETYEIEVSGYNAATGDYDSDVSDTEEADSAPASFLLLAIAAAALISACVMKKGSGKNVSLFQVILAAGHIGGWLIWYAKIKEYVQEQGQGLMEIEKTGWFTLNIVCGLVFGLIALLTFLDKKKTGDEETIETSEAIQ